MKKGKKKKREKRAKELPAFLEDSKNAPGAEEPGTADPAAADVPLRYASQTVGGKWKIRVLWALRSKEPMRYGQVKQAIPGITDMMLSNSLKELASSGLVERRQFKEIPPKVEYCLTPDGAEVIPIIRMMYDWAEKRMKGDKNAAAE